MRRDIDDALQGWSSEPETGQVIAREVRARDGRTVIQMRVELGVLQMETGGRPDGARPHGFASYLDYLRYRAAGRGLELGGKAPSWTMASEHCQAADREFIQFYHRRVAWLALQRYDRAFSDANHTLALMDFVLRHGGDEAYIATHERYRGLVLFHRARAAAATALQKRRPEEAIDLVHDATDRIRKHDETWGAEHEDVETHGASLIEQLTILEHDIRKNFAVEKTLREQLDEAVATEDYERAAKLRDEIRDRTGL